jgi:DNA-binding FadR family transcriptional regulator
MTQVAPTSPGGAPLPTPWTSKRASQIAWAVEWDILVSARPIGTSLGSESDLATQYSVSRTVFREAVRILEHRRVAVMRMGPGGGLTVCEPDLATSTSEVEIYLSYAGATLDHILETRQVIEPLAAALAADSGTEEAMADLRAALEAETAWDVAAKTGRAQENLMAAVAAASGNAAVILFTEVLSRLTARYAFYPGDVDGSSTALFGSAQQIEMGHTSVVAAITSGDPGAAGFRQQRHLDALTSLLTPAEAPGPLHAEAGSKTAERTAAAIAATIAKHGWPVGKVLGSEPALLAELDVSRAVLREAVRILEHHRIAGMRRGRGGGLVVARPDRRACIDALALLLPTERLSLRSLYAARRAVELRIVDLAAARITDDPNLAELLSTSLEQERALHGVGRDAFSCDLHAVLASLCGNPVLALLSSVLSEVWARTVDLHDPTFDWCGASDAVVGVHAKIASALAGGERDLARRRMAKHLDALSFWWS